MYVCLGGALIKGFSGDAFSDVASRAWPRVGVIGETGGRTGEADRDLVWGEGT